MKSFKVFWCEIVQKPTLFASADTTRIYIYNTVTSTQMLEIINNVG